MKQTIETTALSMALTTGEMSLMSACTMLAALKTANMLYLAKPYWRRACYVVTDITDEWCPKRRAAFAKMTGAEVIELLLPCVNNRMSYEDAFDYLASALMERASK